MPCQRTLDNSHAMPQLPGFFLGALNDELHLLVASGAVIDRQMRDELLPVRVIGAHVQIHLIGELTNQLLGEGQGVACVA